MNKISLAALLFLIGACEQTSQITTNPDFSKYPPNSEVQDYSDTPGLSKVTVMFADNVEQQGDYLNGKRNGTWTEYHKNGLVKSITTFVDGQQHGIQIDVDDKGQLVKKAFYHNGLYDGEFLYYKNGKIAERRNYENGKLEGSLSKYYTTGTVMEESNYSNDKIHGLAKWYDKEGNVTIEYEYENGELVNKE